MPNKRIGHAFRYPDLLAQALRHRSAGQPHNERLEFLGDSIINLLAAEALYGTWEKADEGALTRARTELVRESALAGIARSLDLGQHLVLGLGEMKSGGHRRDSILADALEAVVGAVYLDAGLDAARQVAMSWFQPLIDALPPPNKVGKDGKTRLQEWLQGRGKPLPAYALVEESGEEHARRFSVTCTLSDPPRQTPGEGSSRRMAEQDAAAAMLATLE